MPTPSFEDRLKGRRILLTGHTGFTGTWALHWFDALGCEVTGLSLAPDTDPSMFVATGAEALCARHIIGDIRDAELVRQAVAEVQPELILHLAAQTLVPTSYAEPVETYAANLMGTVHILDAARRTDSVDGVVCITTDKVYENREWLYPYREVDALGGKDPYSASKACCELAIASYRASLPSWGQGLNIVSARGGNIIGGGDWSDRRLVPDIARAAASGAPIVLRNPAATRPWQHVACLVHGYMMLLDQAAGGPISDPEAGAWNLGPQAEDCIPVGDLVQRFATHFGDMKVDVQPVQQSEAQLLMLDSAKARQKLGWAPAWGLEDTIAETANWYRDYYADPSQAAALTRRQIAKYRDCLASV
ncbi:MAG: CDP-glucose 4,6-dehydratase [Pseudomonadota bacterium]